MNRTVFLVAGAWLAVVCRPASGAKLCTDVKGNIVANCGFEDGTYTSTIKKDTNPNVPVDWDPSLGFDIDSAANSVVTSPVRTGDDALSIGNGDNQKLAALTQSLTDVSGELYKGRLWIDYQPDGRRDPNAFFAVLIDGNPVVGADSGAPEKFKRYNFAFIGTGSDTITLEGSTKRGEWYVDDAVVKAVNSPVPEPAEMLPLAGIASALGALAFRKRPRPAK